MAVLLRAVPEPLVQPHLHSHCIPKPGIRTEPGHETMGMWTSTPAITMRADSSAALNQASTPSLSSTGGPIAGKEPVKGGARVTAAGLSRSSLPAGRAALHANTTVYSHHC